MYQNPPPSYVQAQTPPVYVQTTPVYVQQQASPVHIVQAPAPVAVITQQVGPESFKIQCPRCGCHVGTERHYEIGTCTFLGCVGLGLMSAGLLSFIPFCVESCKDVRHTCPACHNYLGTYRRL